MEKIAIKAGNMFRVIGKDELPKNIRLINTRKVVIAGRQLLPLYRGEALFDVLALEKVAGGPKYPVIDGIVTVPAETYTFL